jgi:voltage-gated potassium channel
VLWAAFVFEFALRLVIAPSTARFLRRNWWQVALLALPFLSFLRLIRMLRIGRAGRIVSAAVRASRTAGQALRSRLLWLAAVHAIVVLGTSELLVEVGEFRSLAHALHDVAIAAVVGEPMTGGGTVTRVLEVVLAIYSAVVFASLAGAVGAFFLERRREGETAEVAVE